MSRFMVSGCDVPVGTFEIPRVKSSLAANAPPADSFRKGRQVAMFLRDTDRFDLTRLRAS
jgi:hypothetical protein